MRNLWERHGWSGQHGQLWTDTKDVDNWTRWSVTVNHHGTYLCACVSVEGKQWKHINTCTHALNTHITDHRTADLQLGIQYYKLCYHRHNQQQRYHDYYLLLLLLPTTYYIIQHTTTTTTITTPNHHYDCEMSFISCAVQHSNNTNKTYKPTYRPYCFSRCS